MTIITSAICLIIGLFLGRKSCPKTPIDPKEHKALQKEVAFLKEESALYHKRYNDLRLRHNKLVDLVTSALDKKAKKKQ